MEDLTETCGAEYPVPAGHSADALGEIAADCCLPAGHSGQHHNGTTAWPALRRLPWKHDGRDAFVSAGTNGYVTQLADQMEELATRAAKDLAAECRKMAREPRVPADVLRRALIMLAAVTEDAANVAELRGERLGLPRAEEPEGADMRAPLYGQHARQVDQSLRSARGQR